MDEKKLKRILVGGIVGFVLIVVGISLGNIIWNNVYSATLYLLVAPSDSRILVNGEAVAEGNRRVKPGEYEIEISRKGFETEIRSVNLVGGGIEEVIVALVSNDPSTADWYETHEDDAGVLDAAMSTKYMEESSAMAEEYDIVENLPVYKYSYILGYGTCADNGGPDFCVVIRAEFGYRDEAVEYLQNTGKDMAKYYVEVADYSSPFSEVTINVPDGLKFDAGADSELNTQVLETDSAAINAVINERISKMANIYDMAKTSEIKCFGGGKYCGVKVAVYDAEKYDEAEMDGEIEPEDTIHDTYRMILAKVDDKWRVISDLKFLLDYDSNPKIPREVVKLVDEL